MRRLTAGLTQDKVAKQLGVTFQQLQKYEKGRNRISASRLQVLAGILGVPAGFFFEQDEATTLAGIDPPKHSDHISRFLGTREGLELNRAFLKIPNPKTRKAILDLAKTMSSGLDGGSMDYSDVDA
jgi:transcriptional regulator with XRE-family HTH domain